MSSLSRYAKNVYSQNGEDGIIQEICKRLSIEKGHFVEFGAWDGKHLSNTFSLLEQEWSGVYIEGNADRFNDLESNIEPFGERIEALQAYVEAEGDQSLDSLLRSTSTPANFDLLSIDIDSYDWHVWHGLSEYMPLIVVIEINSSIPVGILQTHRGGDRPRRPGSGPVSGSSFSSMVDLGTRKGYTAVCHTANVIFVRNDVLHMLNLPQVEIDYPEVLFDYRWTPLYFQEPMLEPLQTVLRTFGRVRRRLVRR